MADVIGTSNIKIYLKLKLHQSCVNISASSKMIKTSAALLLLIGPLLSFGFAPTWQNRAALSFSTRLFGEEVDLVTEDAGERMSKSVESVQINLQSVRTGRANAQMLDRVKVDYYGAETPVNQMATISAPSAQQLSIDPYDKSSLADIESAIMESDLGLTPNNDGNVIRINIPSMTEDRRKEMLKLCKSIGEDGKVAIRNIRRDGVDNVKKLEKAGDIGEDEMKDGQEAMQKLTDAKIKEIENVVGAKEKEVMTV